jgi:hypothetical protein
MFFIIIFFINKKYFEVFFINKKYNILDLDLKLKMKKNNNIFNNYAILNKKNLYIYKFFLFKIKSSKNINLINFYNVNKFV